jgi:signal transduction histidine kinase
MTWMRRRCSGSISAIARSCPPVNGSTRTFSETLLLGRVRSEAEARRSLELIQQESRRLTHLVENVLYFSRGERGLARISPAPVRLADIVSELVEARCCAGRHEGGRPFRRARRSAPSKSIPPRAPCDAAGIPSR